MKPKALYILDEPDLIYSPDQRALVDKLVDVIGPPQTAKSAIEQPALLKEVEIILAGWGAPTLDALFLDLCPNLRAFFYGAGSVRGFTTDAFWERGIRLTSSYAANAVPVAEYALSTIFLSLKRFWFFDRYVRQNRAYPPRFPRQHLHGGFGSKVGVVSLGMIGQLVCERLQPFDLVVLAYDPYVAQSEADRLDVELVDLESLFAQCDVVSIHTPWLDETVGLVNGALIRSMKLNTTLINTSRGAIVRESELIEVLQERTDLWAILDVTWPEPPEQGSPLYTMPNVILTPHIAGSQAEECWRMGQYAVEELQRFLTGTPLKWEITREKARRLA